jgi:hypothetical protein
MWKITTAQQWAHEAQKEKGEEIHSELLEEYWQHVAVFNKWRATRFSPK